MSTPKKDLHAIKNQEYAEHALRFFKTGKGEYGEGDKFLGVRVPNIRAIAKTYPDASLKVVDSLIESKWHEERMLGLFIIVNRYTKLKKKDPIAATKIYKYYLSKFKYINNWDLVDSTCHKIIGPELIDKDRAVLFKWAKSKDLWTKRISMMSTYYLIQRHQFDETLKIAEILLLDEHDLIHKIVGWMLREVGNKNKAIEDKFLKKHYKKMPRTMLRYAIEKYPQNQRKQLLAGMF